jgi:SPP1 gp7 family putative phage head morphogenesis protein
MLPKTTATKELAWQDEDDLLYSVLFPLVFGAALAGAQSALDGLTAIGIGVDWGLVNKAARDWARQYTFDLVKGINGTSRQFLQQAVGDWIQSGQPIDDLVKQLEPLYGSVRAEMISVTEATRAFAEGNLTTWTESGVVDSIRWMTAEDELVCPICEPLDGKEGSLTDGIEGQKPPAHVRCRCWLEPVVKI